MAKKKKTTNSATRTSLIVLCVFLGVILAVLLGLTVYAEYLLNQMNYVNPNETLPQLSQEEADALLQDEETEPADPDFTGPELSADDVDLGTAPVETIGGENIVNILLIGQDTRDKTRARSDTMILCTFNKEKNTITMTSFMRDMYVRIPGYINNRINASYTWGGMQLLNQTLEENFGIQVDGNVEIDFNHFAELIDLLGGIELELTNSEAAFINRWAPEAGVAKAGVNLLNGTQALWYARNRSDSAGDFNRTNRQRILLTTLLNEYKNSSLTELIAMMDDVLPMVTTDMTKDEILGYVKDFFPMLASAEIITQRIPVDGGYYQAKIEGMSVLVPYLDQNIQVLVESLSGESESVG